ncbi:hypothetical protein [Actinomyces sp. 2119]|nr:hypothetical protein [Actinomyces sp. 2119]
MLQVPQSLDQGLPLSRGLRTRWPPVTAVARVLASEVGYRFVTDAAPVTG